MSDDYKSKSVSKLKYGASLSAGLTHMMINQKDAVGLILFDENIKRYVPPRTSKSHRNIIFNSLAKCRAGQNTNIRSILDIMAERIKKRGLVILISDLLDEPDNVLKGLNHFRHNKQEVIVFHLMDRQEFNFDFNDKFFQTIDKLLEHDLIKTNNKKTILTEKGKLLSDSIFVLFQEEINSNSF